MDNRRDWQPQSWYQKNKLLICTLLGVLAGILLGLALRSKHQHNADLILLIGYPGEIFMRMLKLIILPLIISSLITGTSSLSVTISGKLAVRTFTYFLLTSAFNAAFGVFLVSKIKPGLGSAKIGYISPAVIVPDEKSISILDSVLDMGRNIIPDNLFQATFQQVQSFAHRL